ncbi:hypothetical protein [Alkalihalobacillus sp. 1P02AB]|uniref:hypothetical protein n=1 Tax=Alkalihalobacillus sp. 1P02AB TaxID=3132260 RepID=UPI0039A5C911
MRRHHFICLFLVVIAISGCSEEKQDLTRIDTPLAVVSHAKEPKLMYLDLEQGKVVNEVNTDIVVSYMIRKNQHQYLAINQLSDHIYIFDSRDQSFQPFVTINQGLNKIVISEVGNNLFIADKKNNVVHVVDSNNGIRIQSIPIAEYPSDMILDENNNRLIVLSVIDPTISIIDLNTLTVVNDFPVNEYPAGLFYDADEEFVWTGGHGTLEKRNNFIYAYNIQEGQLMKEVSIGFMPMYITGNPTGKYFYVLSHGDRMLTKFNKVERKTEAKVEVGQNPNYVSIFSGQIFVTSLDDNVITVIDEQKMNIIENIKVGQGPYSIVFQE